MKYLQFKATWTFAEPPPPPCEPMWTFSRLPPSPFPVHVVCERPLREMKIQYIFEIKNCYSKKSSLCIHRFFTSLRPTELWVPWIVHFVKFRALCTITSPHICKCIPIICLAINRTPHFGVWSALAPPLNIGCVRITAPALTPALHLLLKKPIFLNFVKRIFISISGPLFRKNRFEINFFVQRNASKFAIFIEKENPCSFYRFSFRATLSFPLWMPWSMST